MGEGKREGERRGEGEGEKGKSPSRPPPYLRVSVSLPVSLFFRPFVFRDFRFSGSSSLLGSSAAFFLLGRSGGHRAFLCLFVPLWASLGLFGPLCSPCAATALCFPPSLPSSLLSSSPLSPPSFPVLISPSLSPSPFWLPTTRRPSEERIREGERHSATTEEDSFDVGSQP